MESSEIPQVEFLRKKGWRVEFEHIRLSELMARKDQLPVDITLPHRVHFHHIFYITSGRGTHHIDFVPYDFCAGSLFFVAQEQVHAFDSKPDIEGYVSIFTVDYLKKNLFHSEVASLSRLYNYHLFDPLLLPEEIEDEHFGAFFQSMDREYELRGAGGADEILRLMLKVLLLKVERVKPAITSETRNAEWYVRFDQLRGCLATCCSTTRSVRDYAEMLKLSPKHLNTICKSVAGVTAKQCIDDFLVLEIKRVLATSADSVQDIAFAFGFDEPTNFVKYFKKHAGLSPTRFRTGFTQKLLLDS